MTCGGYAESIVVVETCVLSVPTNLVLAAIVPLPCATSPLLAAQTPKGRHGAARRHALGLGGPGHVGVKFAHAFGARTVVIATSTSRVARVGRFSA